MRRKVKRVLGFLFAAMTLVCMSGSQVFAAESIAEVDEKIVFLQGELAENISLEQGDVNENLRATTFINAGVAISCSSEGLLLEFVTSTNKEASTIGVKDIVIQKKVWYGWSTVAVAADGGEKNTSMSVYRVLYRDAVKGTTYRVTCNHYADVDGYRELADDTGEFVFTY